MVNAPSAAGSTSERRRREREPAAAQALALGATKLNPFGDLHTLQHVSARLARSLKPVWEQLLRREVRSFAERSAATRSPPGRRSR